MGRIAVIGAGAAGLTAAGFAARRGMDVVLIERNSRPGRKLMITGKGRCNVTNDCDIDEFMANVPVNNRFLYSSLSSFGPRETMSFFEELGLVLKVERGKRVFPASDRAVDVVDALAKFVKNSGCKIINERVSLLDIRNGSISGIWLEGGAHVPADAVIICTGGLSYPQTGSTGDGYEMARLAGHTVVPLRPSLVPLETVEDWPFTLQGLTLKNVTLSVIDQKNGLQIFKELGEMLFTHYGFSGPLVLSASAHMREMEPERYELCIDLKPGLDEATLDIRLKRDLLKYSNHDFINSLDDLLPSRLIPVIVSLTGIDPRLKANQLSREMRLRLLLVLKKLPVLIKGFRSVEEAVVTSGGIKTGEVNPKTMESKIIKNLYFAGEILDVDAYTGGFNLQIAFSTGYIAGQSALS